MRERLLRLLRVPERPDAPPGAGDSLETFRAAPGYFRYTVLMWFPKQVAALSGLLFSLAFFGSLGNGSAVNDGVVIGEYSLIASGTVIVDNVEIPARSLVVGAPGKVRGEVRDRHLERMKWYSDVYIEKTERYKRQGNLESERIE